MAFVPWSLMSENLLLGAAIEELANAVDARTSLCLPFLRVLPVTGAAVSTLGAPFGSETVCASDSQAARLDELQFDLGEGPCWDALASRRPVLHEDLHTQSSKWPLFAEAVSGSGVGAMYAFPLALGSLSIGAVDLYATSPRSLTAVQVEDAETLAAICSRQVLRRALAGHPLATTAPDDGGFSRREVHQATGMVLAQLGVNAADALLIINGYAFARGRTVRGVAADIVARRIDLAEEWSDPSESL